MLLSFGLVASHLVAQPKVFNVASVRPSRSADGEVVADLKPGGLFVGRSLSVMAMIQLAWNMQTSQISGTPAWIQDRYDIDARADYAGKLDFKQLMAPMQQLLKERCKLVVREDTRPASIFYLDVVKPGPGLKQSPGDGEPSLAMSWRQLVVQNAPMSGVAEILSRQLEVKRPVVDRTGLAGKFDFTLDFFPEGGSNPDHRPPAGTQVSIFTALRDQLWLKLTPDKGTEPILIVDRIEKPSEN